MQLPFVKLRAMLDEFADILRRKRAGDRYVALSFFGNVTVNKCSICGLELFEEGLVQVKAIHVRYVAQHVDARLTLAHSLLDNLKRVIFKGTFFKQSFNRAD